MTPRSVSALLTTVLALLSGGCPSGGGGNADNGRVRVYDDVWVASNAGPGRVLVDADAAWVVNYLANSIDVVDLTTCGSGQASCSALGTVNLQEGSGPFDGVIANGTAYVVESNLGRVAAIDTTTRQVVATISTGAAALMTPQAVAVAGGDLFVAESNFYGSGPGYLAKVQSNVITGTIPSTQLQPIGFTNLPDGSLAVTNLGYVDFFVSPPVATSAGGIDFVNPATGVVVDNIDLGLTAPVSRIALHGDHGYTVSGTLGTLLRVNLTTGQVDSIGITGADSFLTWTEVVGDRLFVLSSNEDRIYVFDAATTQPIDVGNGSNVISVGPGGDTPKGPSHAATWVDGTGVTHLLVVMALANSVTDVVLPDELP